MNGTDGRGDKNICDADEPTPENCQKDEKGRCCRKGLDDKDDKKCKR